MAAPINQGDNVFYWRVMGIVGLIILALMALARVLAWYVFRFGRRQLDAQLSGQPMSQRKMGWEIAWKPVLMLMVMVYAIVCIPIGWMWFQEKRTIAALPVATVDDTG
jgi:TRAP-type C4-dicarboxylate transport system permease large subunit